MGRAFVVDRSRLSRSGLLRLLGDAGFEIVGEASGIERVPHGGLQADFAIVSVHDVSEYDVMQADIAALRSRLPDIKVILLTRADADPRQLAALSMGGVDGVLLNDMSSRAFVAAIHLVMAGETLIPSSRLIPLVMKDVSRRSDLTADPSPQQADLSPREFEILGHLLHGSPNKVIANSLDLAEPTVKAVVRSLLRKLNVANRTQAAIWADRSGLF